LNLFLNRRGPTLGFPLPLPPFVFFSAAIVLPHTPWQQNLFLPLRRWLLLPPPPDVYTGARGSFYSNAARLFLPPYPVLLPPHIPKFFFPPFFFFPSACYAPAVFAQLQACDRRPPTGPRSSIFCLRIPFFGCIRQMLEGLFNMRFIARSVDVPSFAGFPFGPGRRRFDDTPFFSFLPRDSSFPPLMHTAHQSHRLRSMSLSPLLRVSTRPPRRMLFCSPRVMFSVSLAS